MSPVNVPMAARLLASSLPLFFLSPASVSNSTSFAVAGSFNALGTVAMLKRAYSVFFRIVLPSSEVMTPKPFLCGSLASRYGKMKTLVGFFPPGAFGGLRLATTCFATSGPLQMGDEHVVCVGRSRNIDRRVPFDGQFVIVDGHAFVGEHSLPVGLAREFLFGPGQLVRGSRDRVAVGIEQLQ